MNNIAIRAIPDQPALQARVISVVMHPSAENPSDQFVFNHSV